MKFRFHLWWKPLHTFHEGNPITRINVGNVSENHRHVKTLLMIGCLRVFRLDFFFHFMFSQHFSHVLATFRYKNDLVRVEKREFFCVEYPMVLPRTWYENYPDVWVSFLIGTLLAEKQKCQHLILMTGCNLSVLQSFRNLEHASV